MKFGNVSISESRLKCFAQAVFDECIEFYEDPENMKRFEEWKAARDAKAAAKGEPA